MGKVEGQIRFIRWFVATSRGVARTALCCFGLVQKAKLWELLGIGVLLMLLNRFAPRLGHLLLQALHTR